VVCCIYGVALDITHGPYEAGRKIQGVQGAHLNPRGPLLTHLHTVYMAYSECLPTHWLRGPVSPRYEALAMELTPGYADRIALFAYTSMGAVIVGLGRIVAWYHRISTPYHIH
jgi:hypothetical protein